MGTLLWLTLERAPIPLLYGVLPVHERCFMRLNKNTCNWHYSYILRSSQDFAFVVYCNFKQSQVPHHRHLDNAVICQIFVF